MEQIDFLDLQHMAQVQKHTASVAVTKILIFSLFQLLERSAAGL